MKKFNFSPSSIGLYMNSQLQFYFQYLSYQEQDTQVVQAYGRGGSVVHNSLEYFHHHRDKKEATQYFIREWTNKKLDTLLGLNGKPLSKQQYYEAFLFGCSLIEEGGPYKMVESEMEIIKDFKEGTQIKGYIDCVTEYEGKLCIMDYKTSASMDSDKNGTFRNQVLFYTHLYWRETGKIINRARIEYLKLKKAKDFTFTNEEILNYEKDILIPIWNEIQKKGDNPRNYELGDWQNPFNAYKKACYKEKLIRDNAGAIQVHRIDNYLVFKNGFEGGIKDFVNHYFSYDVQGANFSDAYKKKLWDGKKRFLKKNKLPFSYIWKLQELIDAYNNRFKTTYWLDMIDKREPSIANAHYSTEFKENNFELRPYQKEAVTQAMQKKFGILYLGTSSGKTVLSAELIKMVNRRTLFLVNRIELVRQTAEEFHNYLGLEIGQMSEGNIDIDHQITVASIQTISAILKRKNEDSKKLKKYLFNVTCCIADESQNIKDSGMYKQISDEIVNTEYMIGLSGSPFRNGTDTLEMNALVGFIIYSKSTKELEDEGWITPTKTYFLGCPQNEDQYESNEYHENYQSFITKNGLRNDTIKSIVGAWKKQKKILVLVKSIEHGEILEEMIPDSFFLYGSTAKKKRKDMFEQFKNENGLVMISMVSIMGTGINIPDLDIIINASAFGSDISSVQTIGRVKRKAEGKKFGYFIDFNDSGIFQPMANKRMKMLKEFGNPVDSKLHITEWEKMKIE